MIGFLLIIIGLLFLLKNLGLISGSTWDILWPALLIVAGLNMIIRRRSPWFFWEEQWGWRKKEIDKEKQDDKRG